MFRGFTGGTWLFKDKVAGTSTTVVVGQNSNWSSIQKAFTTAIAALTPASNNNVYGFDPRGREHRCTSISLGATMG